MAKRSLVVGLLCGAPFASSLPAQAPVDPSKLKPGFNLFSKQQDIQVGREAAQEAMQQHQVVNDELLQNYFQKIGLRLAATRPARDRGFTFTFTVLNESEVNAFALPGGPMFVFTGLLRSVENEGQLAGVMGHEMSHVILRHGTNQASKANLLQLPALLAQHYAAKEPLLAQLAQAGINFSVNSVLLKFSRADESQADSLGADIMAEAGYDPAELARFFAKLGAGGDARGPQFFSDHPNPGNRDEAIEAEIRTFPRQNYGYQTGQFDSMKAELRSVPAPTKRGAFRASAAPAAAPSATMRPSRGRYLTVAYPDNWQAYGDSDSGSITVAPPNGLVKAANGATQVGYGAILSYFAPEEGGTTLKAATEDLIHHLRTNNPHMQVVEVRTMTTSGGPGRLTVLQNASPFGGDEMDAVLTIGRPEGLFYMLLTTPMSSFDSVQGAFLEMIRSLRFNP